MWALYLHGLRGIFGIGRSTWAKITAFGILGVALIPAVVQLGIAALSPADVEVVAPEDYYQTIEPLLAIFCALVAPDLVGRDQRTQTLSLYFSRALRREDYAFARYAAFVTSILVLTVVPQMLMYVGNVAAATDVWGAVRDTWEDIPAILASALLLSVLIAGIGVAVSSQTTRRSYATVTIVAVFVLATGISTAIFESAGPDDGRYALLFSPFHVVRGMTLWVFGVSPALHEEEQLYEADFNGIVYAIDAVIVSLACLALVIRRYRNVSA
jgi:ABC-2 type transport system permease protein